MLFTSVELATRIERAECALISGGVRAAQTRRNVPDAFVTPFAGAVAAYSEPGSPLNKVAGLGFAPPPAPAEFGAIERAYFQRGSPVQVELATLADSAVAAMLTERGYVLRGFENVLGRPLPFESSCAQPDGVEISACRPEEARAWLDVVVTGFAAPDSDGVPSHESFPRDIVERIIGDMSSGAGVTQLLARRHSQPAGGASMRIDGDVAQLCGAATLPQHRRRGIQTAMLHARLAAASRAGCTVAVVTTQPGSKSQQNVQKQGFELLYARAVLVREPTG